MKQFLIYEGVFDSNYLDNDDKLKEIKYWNSHFDKIFDIESKEGIKKVQSNLDSIFMDEL